MSLREKVWYNPQGGFWYPEEEVKDSIKELKEGICCGGEENCELFCKKIDEVFGRFSKQESKNAK